MQAPTRSARRNPLVIEVGFLFGRFLFWVESFGRADRFDYFKCLVPDRINIGVMVMNTNRTLPDCRNSQKVKSKNKIWLWTKKPPLIKEVARRLRRDGGFIRWRYISSKTLDRTEMSAQLNPQSIPCVIDSSFKKGALLTGISTIDNC